MLSVNISSRARRDKQLKNANHKLYKIGLSSIKNVGHLNLINISLARTWPSGFSGIDYFRFFLAFERKIPSLNKIDKMLITPSTPRLGCCGSFIYS